MSTLELMNGETCTAILDLPQPNTDDRLNGPISIGHYSMDESQPDGEAELWMECEGRRIQFCAAHLKDIVKQLKRAWTLAVERRA
jgi:hypothetical protein